MTQRLSVQDEVRRAIEPGEASASGPEVARSGRPPFRGGGALLRRYEVDVSTEDALSKIDVLTGNI